jgi:tRNA uridine 5-carboxymethylaminomethyl modification enzyme
VEKFDVVVIGAGHAGIEAAWAAARMGRRVMLATIDVKSVGFMACNPSIGGIGKSHLVYEIDALGGLMPTVADRTCIQMRTLNAANGPAVRALRAQIDKHDYHATMLKILSETPNITISECEVTDVSPTDSGLTISAVAGGKGFTVAAGAAVVATGVYLNSVVLVGHTSERSGPVGFAPANHLTDSLVKLGFSVRRFKTGTPPRLLSQSINYAKTTPQPPDTDAHFSFMSTAPARNLVSCHLTWTNARTHAVIRENLQRSALFGGLIKGTGPRYCPSIEDKIVRFATAERHQIFLEPESLSTDEVYLQGMSTSLPPDVQREFVQTIDGLERAEIVRNAYAIEYDCIDSRELTNTLESKTVRKLFFAGQVNGTSGYEEAAAQGIVAGINAALSLDGREVVFSRTNSYIGVLVDDLVTLGTNEPYRMFTSRAEHRLFLRQDNADQRLTPLGREIGLVDDDRWKRFTDKMNQIAELKSNPNARVPDDVKSAVEIEAKYAGYLARENVRIAAVVRDEKTLLPAEMDYDKITALRREAQIKLSAVRPKNIAQAARISGVTPADVNILLVWLRKNQK